MWSLLLVVASWIFASPGLGIVEDCRVSRLIWQKWWFGTLPPPHLHACMWEKFVLAFRNLPHGSHFTVLFRRAIQKDIFPRQKKIQYRRFSQFRCRTEFPNRFYRFNICFKKLDFTNMYILNCILSLCSTSKNNSNFIL